MVYTVSPLAMVLMWGFAGVWCLAVLGMAALVLAAPPPGDEKTFVLLFLGAFLMAGLFLVTVAARMTASRRRFGHSTLVLDHIPAVLGGAVSGVVTAPRAVREAAAFRVALDCVEVSLDSDFPDQVLWREEAEVAPEEVDHAPDEVRIPLSIAVPAGARATSDPGQPGDRVAWRVSVHADLKPRDYDARFDVPVFPAALVAGGPPAPVRPASRPPTRPRSTRFRVKVLRDGSAIQLPTPGWVRPWTIGVLLLVPLAGLVGMHPSLRDVPYVFFPVGGAVAAAALLGLMALSLLATPNRVEVHPGRLVVRRGVFGLGWDRAVSLSEIAAIKVSPLNNGPRVDWTVDVETRGGKTYNAALGLRDGGEAKWLVEEMQRMVDSGRS